MRFAEALSELKKGKLLQRQNWRRAWVRMLHVEEIATSFYQELPDGVSRPWTPTSTDIFANDWKLLGDSLEQL